MRPAYNVQAARALRSSLAAFSSVWDIIPDISYIIEEAVQDDCYGLFGTRPQSPCSVIDIGANVGVVSLAMHSLGQGDRIVAIEPVPSTARALVEALAGTDVECCIHGLGHGEKFYISGAVNPVYSKATSTGGHEAYGMPLKEILERYTDQDKPLLLKIDCEGGETALLVDKDSSSALRDRLKRTGGSVGLEVHYGREYPHATSHPVSYEDWLAWLTEYGLGQPNRKALTPTTDILRFHHYPS